HPTLQIEGQTPIAIARALAAPYGIVCQTDQPPGIVLPQLMINLGETGWEVIDRVMRVAALIGYDLPTGDLMFTIAGAGTPPAAGVGIGSNIDRAQVSYSMDQRFSEYEPHILSTQMFSTDIGLNQPAGPSAFDPGVPRFRKRFVVSEQ